MKKFKLLLASALVVSFLSGCSFEKMKLKKENVTIEYGDKVSSDVKDYLDNTDEFLKDVKIEGIPNNESEKKYPNVGEYELTLKNDKEEQKVKLSVKDTVAPTFSDIKDSHEVEYGDKFNINGIKAEDLSKVELSLDDSKVNYKKSGTYKATIVAKDLSGNETKKDISIIVKEEKKKNNTPSTSDNKSNKNSSSSKSKSSTNKSNSSNSNSSKEPSNNGSSSVIVTPDKDSYYEFNNGKNWADGASGLELPKEWGY